jgi:hypothetical protein
MNSVFDICRDFDPYKCWDYDCYDVEENLIYDENGEIVDEELYCSRDVSSVEICPLRKRIESQGS